MRLLSRRSKFEVPCVDVDGIFPCFVIQGKTTAYAEGKISETTRLSLANAVRVAIENGNLETSDNRLLDVTYRDLNRFPIPDNGGPGDGGQNGGDGPGDGVSGGDRDPNDIDLDPDDDGLQSWAIALIAVGGALTMCFAYLCLRRPSHSSLDVDDSSSSSSSSSSGSSSSSSESEERYPLRSTPEPPAPPPAPRPVFTPPAAAPAPAPREPATSSPPGGDGMRLVKVIKRASAKPSPKVAPAPNVMMKVNPGNSDTKSSPSSSDPASGSSVGTPVEQASSEEGSYDGQIDRPSPHKQASAFTLDMGEDLRDAASGLTTDLEFSQPSFTNNEFNKPQNEFGGINEFERAPSSHDPGSSAGTPSSSYEEVVEEYEIEYDDEEEVSGSGEGQDDESSEVFWDEELNDVDDNEFAVSADLR